MSKLTYLIIHCTATPEGRDVTKEDIIRMHTAPQPKGRGWKKVGYSDMILLDGTLENLSPYNDDDTVDQWEITNGVAGKNSVSRHIVYVGGLDKSMNTKNTLTKAQGETLKNYLLAAVLMYPKIKIAGHNQFAAKDCPSFNVIFYCKAIGIPDKNIYQA